MNTLPEAPLGRPIRLAVLISGGGTTLDNFMRKIAAHELDARIGVVISSSSECVGNQKAETYQLPLVVVERDEYDSVHQFSNDIFAICRQHDVDLVLMGGFLCLIEIPQDFEYRVLNIHPSLIPAFCGRKFYGGRVHQAVYDRGAKVSGCTVHFADNQYDHGPIILQRAVEIAFEDTPHEIAARVFEQECEAYPEAVRLYAQGQLRLNNGRVQIIH